MFGFLAALCFCAGSLPEEIDRRVEAYWLESGVKAAPLVDDVSFLRRATLDLAGRVPTLAEAQAFCDEPSPDKRQKAIRRLMQGAEHPLHFGRVLDDLLQGRLAGDSEFLDYLRTSAAERKPWDRIFREVLLGPYDTPERKKAERFLSRRVNNLEDLTTDTTRAFFGVDDVSCARCHDHPLVHDWKQDHYFGMASFFNPTYEASKGRNARNGGIQEKQTAAVSYVTTKGQKRTAQTMFLSGKTFAEPVEKAAFASRRQQLVEVALEEREFLSRSIVNRLWAYFFGRGLVQPLDQMHSANPPAIPELLEWLAEDFAENGYKLDRLVEALVSTRAYQLASTRGEGEESNDRHFSRALLRPLTPQQFAMSVVLIAGEGTYDQSGDAATRAKRFRDLESQSASLIRPGLLDGRGERYQASTGEALFLSNHPDVQRLLQPTKTNLVGRLSAMDDPEKLVDVAVWTVLGRPPVGEERAFLAQWVQGQGADRGKACSQLVWALLASAEFRFNH